MSRSSERELCYVLKSIPFRERDLILQLLSEQRGRFSAIARNGVQSRRFGGTLDLFTCSEFELGGKAIRIAESGEETLFSLESGVIRFAPKSLSSSLEKLGAASCLNELTLRMLPPQKPAPEVFKLVSNTLVGLDESPSERALPLVNAFILKMTQWLGVQPSLTRCLRCETPLHEAPGESVQVQVAQGAWLCDPCLPGAGAPRLSKLVILDALHSLLHPIRKVEFLADLEDHSRLLGLLEQHLQYFVPGFDREKISSIRFLKSPESPL